MSFLHLTSLKDTPFQWLNLRRDQFFKHLNKLIALGFNTPQFIRIFLTEKPYFNKNAKVIKGRVATLKNIPVKIGLLRICALGKYSPDFKTVFRMMIRLFIF